MLSSESTIRKLTYKNKQPKTEQCFTENLSLLKKSEAKVIEISCLPVAKFNILLACLLPYSHESDFPDL